GSASHPASCQSCLDASIVFRTSSARASRALASVCISSSSSSSCTADVCGLRVRGRDLEARFMSSCRRLAAGRYRLQPEATDVDRLTVLIADDEAPLRLLIRATIGREQFRVLEAGDGRQALDMARRERPDVVLLDVGMPHLSGYDV